jgi:hypothetical protein
MNCSLGILLNEKTHENGLEQTANKTLNDRWFLHVLI